MSRAAGVLGGCYDCPSPGRTDGSGDLSLSLSSSLSSLLSLSLRIFKSRPHTHLLSYLTGHHRLLFVYISYCNDYKPGTSRFREKIELRFSSDEIAISICIASQFHELHTIMRCSRVNEHSALLNSKTLN